MGVGLAARGCRGGRVESPGQEADEDKATNLKGQQWWTRIVDMQWAKYAIDVDEMDNLWIRCERGADEKQTQSG